MAFVALVMRHAEKSSDPDDPDLTPAGKQRAASLATYIPQKFGHPDDVFATAISKHSARPYETVSPLARATGARFDATYVDQDYGALAKYLTGDARFQGKLIVVCWHHGNIPNMMRALGAPDGSYPDPWPGAVFNLILKTTINGNTVIVEQVQEPF